MSTSSGASTVEVANEIQNETNTGTLRSPVHSRHSSDVTDADIEADGRSIVDSFLTDDDGNSLLGDVPNPPYSQRNAATSSFSLSSMLSESTVDSVARHLEDGHQGRTITLAQLCDIIDECGSLERAHILSVECYRERSKMGVLHRTLILHLHRHGRTDVWLRIDRRRSHNVSLLRFALRGGKTEANDVAQLAASKSLLLKRADAIAESRIDFVLPPSLGAFRTCFLAIRVELLEYHLWPENCWFMCSLLQEHLMAAGRGSFVHGKSVDFGLDSPARSQVWDRTLKLRPAPSRTFEQLLSAGAPYESDDEVRQLSIMNAQLKAQSSADPSNRFIRGLVYDMAAIQSALLSGVAKEGSHSEALKHAFAFERSLFRQEYPAEALGAYETLAYLADPVFARLRVLNISRALYIGNPSRHWWRLASQLVELAKIISDPRSSLSRACLDEARSVLSADPTRQLWSCSRIPILQGHTMVVLTVAFSPEGKCIASGSADGTVRLWDALTGGTIGEPLRGHTDWSWKFSVAFSPDSTQLISGSSDGTIRRWDVNSGEAVGEPLRHASSEYINCVAFSPDGIRIASGSNDTTIQLWDASTNERLGEPLSGHTAPVPCLIFSPDGKRIVSGSKDGTVRLWDVSTGRAIGEPLKGHTEAVSSVTFSPDGKLVVSGSNDHTLRRWRVDTGEPVEEAMKGHTDWVLSVAFSPDGKTIASGSADSTIRLWDAITGKSIGEPLEGHQGGVSSVAFSPDGRQIVSASDDCTVRIWDSLDLDRWPEGEY